ncbi:MAG: DoxX family membrane protein [Actinomycetota bacterium]|nr:DoxX family membrane protein [Actinomycetota bacterium]
MLLHRVARPLLGVVSVVNGVETLINPKPKIEATTPVLARGQGMMLPTTQPVNPALVVQAGATVKITAGLLMTLGWAPRIAATVLAVELIPSTVAENPFASVGSPDTRKSRQQHFLSNCGLLGGLLLAITAPGGKRFKHAKKSARKTAKKLVRKGPLS